MRYGFFQNQEVCDKNGNLHFVDVFIRSIEDMHTDVIFFENNGLNEVFIEATDAEMNSLIEFLEPQLIGV